jgi:hypothetical protein
LPVSLFGLGLAIGTLPAASSCGTMAAATDTWWGSASAWPRA